MAVMSTSDANYGGAFKFLLRGIASTDYKTVFQMNYNAKYYWIAETATEDITHYFRQATTNVCTWGWDDGTAAFEIAIGGAFGTAPRYSFDTNKMYIYGSTSADLTIDGATGTAILYLQPANGLESRIHFREDGSTKMVIGYKPDGDFFQIHSGTSITTLAAGDFSVTSIGDIYMGTLASATGTYYMRYNTTSGQVSYTTSDIQDKKDIKPFEVDALDALMKFDPKRFTWKIDNKQQVGWIAQEGMEAIPDMFPFIEKIDRYGMDEFNILPYYHKAIQQLKAEIDELRAQLKNNG
jgi:hypothetical protein